MSAQHTPGPWLLAGDDKTFVYALNEQGYNRFLAPLQAGHIDPTEWTGVEELAANARLIAAAPELLAALNALVEMAEIEVNPETETLVQARAAIAKATGEQA